MNRKLAVLCTAAALTAVITGCSSSKSSAVTTTSTTRSGTSGTETLSAAVQGKAAAANLNNSNPDTPLSFPVGTLTGPVPGTIKPFTLGGGNGCTGQTSWVSSQGALAVTHTTDPGIPCGNSDAAPPATWVKHGKTCDFTATFSKGTFAEIGGALAATTWHGNYVVTATGKAPLGKGRTVCSFAHVGAVEKSGAKISFTASGTLTVK